MCCSQYAQLRCVHYITTIGVMYFEVEGEIVIDTGAKLPKAVRKQGGQQGRGSPQGAPQAAEWREQRRRVAAHTHLTIVRMGTCVARRAAAARCMVA